MRRHLIVGRMGAGDKLEVPKAGDEALTQLRLVASNKRLDYGIGSALDDLAELSVFPSEIGVDLLVFAAHVQAADTRIARASESQDSWTREIRLVVPVSDPARWTRATWVLQKMLKFLTGDRWEIGFRARPSGFEKTVSEPPKDSKPPPFHILSLFSGGLDSLIGAIDLLEDGKVPLLISHGADPTTSHAQTVCFEELRKAYKGAKFERLRLHMTFDKGIVKNGGDESTTRGRSFLFFALGAFAGSGLGGKYTLRVPENGLIALNVPLDPLRLGALSTRTTHPFYLARWNQLLALLGIAGHLEDPYWKKTKGEMVEECKNQELLKALTPMSLSCSSPTKGRWKKQPPGHCGYCMPCLIRRAAVQHAWGKGKDPTDYAQDLHARKLNAGEAEGQHVRSFQLAIERLDANPAVMSVLIHKPGSLADVPNRWKALAGVYGRGMQEVSSLLSRVVTKPG